MSVNPYYLPFKQWADFMVPVLERFGDISNPPEESGWQNWASGVVSLDGLIERGAPSPVGFSSWRDWAVRLIEAVNDGF